MTVGIAAKCENEDDPKVILAADRLVTTQQQSMIEHEHPEAKIEPLAKNLPPVDILCIVAGAVSLGEELIIDIDQRIDQFLESDDPPTFNVRTVAQLAGQQYRHLVQEKVQSHILSRYGFELDDLKRQHQFKDDFFEAMMAEINQIHEVIYKNLTLLMGGVDGDGGHIFEIANGDITGHNKIGYSTIGSGCQPAESEFIQSEYGATKSFQKGLATATAAIKRAEQASGVGGDMDLGVVGQGYTTMANESVITELQDRQDTIDEKQVGVKANILEDETVEWRPGQ